MNSIPPQYPQLPLSGATFPTNNLVVGEGTTIDIHQNSGIEYALTGQQHQGIPIICLHGIGGNCSSFRPQLEVLSKHNPILAWNMPGYGNSAPLKEVTFTNLTQAILNLLNELQIEQAHIIGHSIGGMIAQELALTSPGRVASLALLATTSAFGGKDDHFKAQFLAARLNPLQEGLSMQELARKFVPEIVGPQASEAAIDSAVSSMAQIPETVYKDIMRCLISFDRYQRTVELSQPSVLIAGEKDRNAPVKTMQKMAERMPDADFHILENAGHLVNLEAPLKCNQILSEFFLKS